MRLSWPGSAETAAHKETSTPVGAPPVLRVGGVVPFSSSDWPGRLCAVVFVQGCPWRCSYCHNPELQARPRDRQADSGCTDAMTRPAPAGAACAANIADPPRHLAWQAVLEMLERRVGLLDGVVFSGGEPTLDPGLPGAIAQVRALGYAVGLHSAGIAADRFATLLPRVDWVGLDVKTGYADYARVTGVARSGRAPRHCLELLLASGVAHELRTTYHPALQDDASLLALAHELRELGARHWVLQQWREHEQAGGHSGTVSSNGDGDGGGNNIGSPLAACWRWPDEAVLQALRRALPELVLR